MWHKEPKMDKISGPVMLPLQVCKAEYQCEVDKRKDEDKDDEEDEDQDQGEAEGEEITLQ